MTGRRLSDGRYRLNEKGRIVCEFDLGTEVMVHVKNRKRFIKGKICGVSGYHKDEVSIIHVRDLRHDHDSAIKLDSIESLEVMD